MSGFQEECELLERRVVRLSRDLAEAKAQLSELQNKQAQVDYAFRMLFGDLPEDTRKPDFDIPAQICF